MNIKVMVENIVKIVNKPIATEDYVQKELAKLRKELVDYLKETGIKASIEDLEEQAREHKITLKELYEIIKPEEENLKKLKTNMKTIEDISNAIYKAHTGSKTNISKQDNIKPKCPIEIDEEFISIKETRGTEERYRELMNLNYGSDNQKDYIFIIEMSLEDVPMFKGTTYKDIKAYLDEYKPKFETWKRNNNVGYVISPFKNISNNSNKRGGYYYGM